MARHKKDNLKIAMLPFGEWLRELRENKNYPLRVVAAAAEMDQAHLSKTELGHRLLTAEQAAAIAKLFGIDAMEMEARRIAEKFLADNFDNPAAHQAVQLLNEDPSIYSKTH